MTDTIPLLKASLHIHTSSDPQDYLLHNEYQLIDYAAKHNFDVLSITCHNKFVFNQEIKEYADSKNIILIPGIEKEISGKHVLILNAGKESEKINTFSQLKDAKKEKDYFVIAPHPFFYAFSSLGSKLIKNIDLFDAIEYSYFYTKKINLNKKAEYIAKKHNLPLIGTSDVHYLAHIRYTYSMIESSKNIKDILQTLKKGKIEIKSRELPSLSKVFIKINQPIIPKLKKTLNYKIQQFKKKHD